MRFAIVAAACSSAAPHPTPIVNVAPAPDAGAPDPDVRVLAAAGISDPPHVAGAQKLAKAVQGHCNDDVADSDQQTLACGYHVVGDDPRTCEGVAALLVAERARVLDQPMKILLACGPALMGVGFDPRTRTVQIDGDVSASFVLPTE